MKQKRILFQMLDNPLRRNSGNKTWNLSLLKYFRERNVIVDFVTEQGWVNWSDDELKELAESGLVNNLFVLKRKPSKKNFFKYLNSHTLPKLTKRKKFNLTKSAMPDYRTAFYQAEFNELLRTNQYDFLLINYVMNAKLIHNNTFLKNTKTIIDTHDFFTSQYQNKPGFKLGSSFEEEIKRLRLFNEVWVSSADELYLFSQFVPNKVRLVQTMLPTPEKPPIAINERKYDLIYVASDNDHNKRSAKWLMDEVYPLLPGNINICVIGPIVKLLPEKPNLEKIGFVDDLNDLYRQSKIAICPMLGGTGIKIKVVEAFSNGLPVVCTERGLDGLLNKTNNGCLLANTAEEFAGNIEKLLTDENLYLEQSRLSRQMFDQFFNIEQAYQRLDKIFGTQQ